MQLTVQTLAERLLETEASKVVAEGVHGSFCLLPRHIDMVSPLVPGLLYVEQPLGAGRYLAVDRGLLVKCGSRVLVAVHDGVAGGELESLLEVVRSRFSAEDEQQRSVTGAMARLEADFLRRFMDLR